MDARQSEFRIPNNMVIAGGATGGHLFPGIAIAQEFLSRHQYNRIMFISIGNAFEKAVLAKYGFLNRNFRKITVSGIKGRGLQNQVKALLQIPQSVVESLRLLNQSFYPQKPDIILGVGSYASAPIVLAARLMKLKSAIHEQNIRPGITNCLLAKLANRIYSSFPNTQFKLSGKSEHPAIQKKILVSGNPIRQEFMRSDIKTNEDDDLNFTVLICGGSQGAHRINMTMIEIPDYLKGVYHIIHQTGTDDETMVRDAYRHKNIKASVKPFFHDMAWQYRKADIIVCRAGATTIAEITAIGKPAIFIPFPHAADNHQELNAAGLVAAGAAEMIPESELTAQRLAQRIDYYATHPNHLRKKAERSRVLGRPDAARRIVDDCYRLIMKHQKSGFLEKPDFLQT
ncbi:undecaprenyldiphospho-muramoylpentapeptide beta-N-acetylglucosaminyltransferase [Desulfococcaceae bacterium HSG9]|nr:undecaprenyldiphospho-muramoylpentapeptide beta-N-acetylglucosaminyltransferase [Desulfococcaceae bacterium HSG9]